MLDGQYPTPSQSQLFIGDIWIDDAYQIDHRYENARIPIYGYNRSEFVKVAHGKELVTGSIIINFRFPNYLGYAIQEAMGKRSSVSKSVTDPNTQATAAMNREEMRKVLQEMKKTDSTGRLKLLAESLDKGTFHQVSGLSRILFDRDLSQVNTLDPDPVRLTADIGGFNCVLTYGHVSGKCVVETIQDCYITGRGKSMSASPGGGGPSSSGSVIYEVYPFIAQRVDAKLMDLSQRSQ